MVEGMTMTITKQQIDTLRLLERSTDIGDGWRVCLPVLFKRLIEPMPLELVARERGMLRARMTDEALIILKWL